MTETTTARGETGPPEDYEVPLRMALIMGGQSRADADDLLGEYRAAVRAATLREAAGQQEAKAELDVIGRRPGRGITRRIVALELRRMAEGVSQ